MSTSSPLSESFYAGAIGLFILFGLFIFGVGAVLGNHIPIPWLLPFVGLALGFVGTELATRTSRWVGSLIGLIVTGFGYGLAASLLWKLPDAAWLRSAFVITTLGTLLLTIFAFWQPQWIRGFGAFLPAAIVAWGLLGVFLQIYSRSHFLAPGATSFLIAVAALAYLDRYWTRALEQDKILDNAVDAACAVFTDALHHLLSLFDRRAP